MNIRFETAIGAALISWAGLATTVSASEPLPLSEVEADLQFSNTNGFGPTATQSGNGSAPAIETAGCNNSLSEECGYAYSSLAPTPRLIVSASSIDEYVYAVATLQYSFTVLGAGAGLVPVDYSANIDASLASNAGSSSSSFGIGGQILSLAGGSVYDCSGGCIATPSLEHLNGTVYLLGSGAISEVTESSYVLLGAGPDQLADGSASASADPYFFIDPTFAAAHPGASLEFSPYAGNVLSSAVPETDVWIMMLLGIGMVGGALRKIGGRYMGMFLSPSAINY